MATMSERATLRYVGPGPVQLPDSAAPDPGIVESGGEVTLDGDAAAWLVTNVGDLWQPVGAAPDGVLKGAALLEALTAAGLPTTGTVAEKRARLVEHEAAQQLAQQEDPEHGSHGAWQNPDPVTDQDAAPDDDQENDDV